jgi:Transcriptional regulator
VELLAERGLAAMSIEEVAARAGVGKTTIYRRWPSKGLLALDAFVDSFREEQPQPDTGRCAATCSRRCTRGCGRLPRRRWGRC